AAALLTEMLAVTGKSISALYREITDTYGELRYCEADFRMSPARKAQLQTQLFEEGLLPAFSDVDRVDRSDGVKLWLSDGSWVICRFSGTEPLLRMAAEAESEERAESLIGAWRELLSL
ncbi:MAG: phosphoglucomutase/phosphomannomutase family protein, partial [Oscillospiraceae bacterium]|nr:phosphoglucomutase/phosphomannomutase family protein [Oscillospiraceae bacterium]